MIRKLGLIVVAIMTIIVFSAAPVRANYGDCIAYDDFNRTNGASGYTLSQGPLNESCTVLAWQQGTISGNKLAISPTLGNNIISNGEFTTNINDWGGININISQADLSSDLSNRYGAVDGGVLYASIPITGLTTSIDQYNLNKAQGSWYSSSYWIYRLSSAKFPATKFSWGNDVFGYSDNSNYDEWYKNIGSFRSTDANGSYTYSLNADINGVIASRTAWIDSIILKPINLNSMFSTVSTNSIDVSSSTNITLAKGTQAGIVLNMDSSNDPQNFIIVYLDGNDNLLVDKCVNGIYTNIYQGSAIYVPSATLQVITNHSNSSTLNIQVFYAGLQIVGEASVTDSAIINNMIYGVFSTNSMNGFDEFYLLDNTSNSPTDTPINAITDTPTFTPTNTPIITITPTITLTPTSNALYQNSRIISLGDIFIILNEQIIGAVLLAMMVLIALLMIIQRKKAE